MRENKNYHSILLGLSRNFDDVIEEMKDSYQDEKYSNWVIYLLLSPLIDISRINRNRKGIESAIKSHIGQAYMIPFISGLSGMGLAFFQEINPWVYSILGIFFGYVFLLPYYFKKMITFQSGHFHTGAYRIFRNQEYTLMKQALLDEKRDYFFKGIYDYLNHISSDSEQYLQIYKMIEEKLDRHHQVEVKQLETKNTLLRERLKKADQLLEKTMEEYESFVKELRKIDRNRKEGMEILIDMIKEINSVLFRMGNGTFSKKDLGFVSAYTIYRKERDSLIKIEDVGTSGTSPSVLSLKEDTKWGAVEVINKQTDKPVINEPYDNRMVVSFRIRMRANGKEEIWVFNFHFDLTDKKPQHLLLKNDIIESREVYRLIHALCLLTSQSMHVKEEYTNGK